MTDEVLFTVNDKGLGVITLNRPKALNSLSLAMVQPLKEKLLRWKNNNHIQIILIKGAGEKGLCAGGDIKALYDARLNEKNKSLAMQFFKEEYELDQLIYDYPKPIIAYLDGIVMGGGVGLTYGANYRIVTERTKWAMPEMNIGFFPDVGAAYFLNKAPGYIGRYLALTAETIHASDVLYIGGADYFIKSEQFNSLLENLENMNWLDVNLDYDLNDFLNQYANNESRESKLSQLQEEIDLHFSFQTLEEILHSLREHPSDFATTTSDMLLSKSPSSLKVTLKQLIDGEEQSLTTCLETDFILARNFLSHSDFYEGVRSVVIDKDRNPQYDFAQLSDFTSQHVEGFFQKK
ncbi:enoyl-CoA hydratase/isomerase family protein [Cytobacillus kochii]